MDIIFDQFSHYEIIFWSILTCWFRTSWPQIDWRRFRGSLRRLKRHQDSALKLNNTTTVKIARWNLDIQNQHAPICEIRPYWKKILAGENLEFFLTFKVVPKTKAKSQQHPLKCLIRSETYKFGIRRSRLTKLVSHSGQIGTKMAEESTLVKWKIFL